jgi:hypothetical protein
MQAIKLIRCDSVRMSPTREVTSCAATQEALSVLLNLKVHYRKIAGFHGGDYEECRLLGYKNPVPTSQETHYVSATEPSRLMLCKI